MNEAGVGADIEDSDIKKLPIFGHQVQIEKGTEQQLQSQKG